MTPYAPALPVQNPYRAPLQLSPYVQDPTFTGVSYTAGGPVAANPIPSHGGAGVGAPAAPGMQYWESPYYNRPAPTPYRLPPPTPYQRPTFNYAPPSYGGGYGPARSTQPYGMNYTYTPPPSKGPYQRTNLYPYSGDPGRGLGNWGLTNFQQAMNLAGDNPMAWNPTTQTGQTMPVPWGATIGGVKVTPSNITYNNGPSGRIAILKGVGPLGYGFHWDKFIKEQSAPSNAVVGADPRVRPLSAPSDPFAPPQFSTPQVSSSSFPSYRGAGVGSGGNAELDYLYQLLAQLGPQTNARGLAPVPQSPSPLREGAGVGSQQPQFYGGLQQ